MRRTAVPRAGDFVFRISVKEAACAHVLDKLAGVYCGTLSSVRLLGGRRIAL